MKKKRPALISIFVAEIVLAVATCFVMFTDLGGFQFRSTHAVCSTCVGNHYTASTPDCVTGGARENWVCCNCYSIYLKTSDIPNYSPANWKDAGSFVNVHGVPTRGDIRYLPPDPNNHTGSYTTHSKDQTNQPWALDYRTCNDCHHDVIESSPLTKKVTATVIEPSDFNVKPGDTQYPRYQLDNSKIVVAKHWYEYSGLKINVIGDYSYQYLIGDPVFAGGFPTGRFNDYPIRLKYSDVEYRDGIHSNSGQNGDMTVAIKIPKGTFSLKVFTGCWNATNTTKLSDGTTTWTCSSFSAGGTGVARLCKFDIEVLEETDFTLTITASNATGNCTLPAVSIERNVVNKSDAIHVTQHVDTYSDNERYTVDNNNLIVAKHFQSSSNITTIGYQENASLIGTPSINGQFPSLTFNDYKIKLYYNGEDHTNGINSNGAAGQLGNIMVPITIPTGNYVLRVFTGCWKAQNSTSLSDGFNVWECGNFSTGDSGISRVCRFNIACAEKTEFSLRINVTSGDGGNCTLPMISIESDSTCDSVTSAVNDVPASINLDNSGFADYMKMTYSDIGNRGYYCPAGSPGYIGGVTSLTNQYNDYATAFTFGSYSDKHSLRHTDGMTVATKSVEGNLYIPEGLYEVDFYVGAWRGDVHIEIEEDGVILEKSALCSGSETSINKIIRITIAAPVARNVKFYECFSPNGNTGPYGNVSVAAITMKKVNGNVGNFATSIQALPSSKSVGSFSNFKDWFHFQTESRKKTSNVYISRTKEEQYKGTGYDYEGLMSWNDGDDVGGETRASVTNFRQFSFTDYGYLALNVTTTGLTRLYVFGVGWNCTYKFIIQDTNGSGTVYYNEIVQNKGDGYDGAHNPALIVVDSYAVGTYNFKIYHNGGNNCGLVALCVE